MKALHAVFREEIAPTANIMGGRFVLTFKHKGTDKELFKARFVVQGNLDREKDLLVHATTMRSKKAPHISCHDIRLQVMVRGYTCIPSSG